MQKLLLSITQAIGFVVIGSGQGEAERTNSAIGDTPVDGATINW